MKWFEDFVYRYKWWVVGAWVLIWAGGLVLVGRYLGVWTFVGAEIDNVAVVLPSPTPTLVPTPTPFGVYKRPDLPKKDSYTILVVGDSMIKTLGPNSDRLREYLKVRYPETVFGIFNYGYGSTNILSLDERLHEETKDGDQTFPGILNRQSDVIILESFAYNPLSEFGVEDGLNRYKEVLLETVTEIHATHPETVIVFLATIAPHRETFGLGNLDLTEERRVEWANERVKYLETFISFAQEHQIPLINVYQESQLENGNGDPTYINDTDHIHPSAAGVELMSEKIAEFLYEQGIIPH